MTLSVAIVIPVLNDWESCHILFSHIDRLTLAGVDRVAVFVVDDGSTKPVPADFLDGLGQGRIGSIAIVDLVCNVGHQRAIALGVATCSEIVADHHVVVMDSDGEDQPADIERLIEALRTNPGAIAVAERARRSEGAKFRAGYATYQALFRALVGRRIDFGNFCALPPEHARRLASTPDTWNHLAAALLRSRVPLVRVPVHRGTRYAGRSSMNVPALIAHGLSAFAVFSDNVFSRLFLFASALGGLSVVGGLVVVFIRFVINVGVPGWATVALGVFLTLFMQAILLCLLGAIHMLSTRSQAGAQPTAMARLYVRGVRSLPLAPGH